MVLTDLNKNSRVLDQLIVPPPTHTHTHRPSVMLRQDTDLRQTKNMTAIIRLQAERINILARSGTLLFHVDSY